MTNLRSREALQMHLGHCLAQLPNHLDVPLVREVGMFTTHDMDLGQAKIGGFAILINHLFVV